MPKRADVPIYQPDLYSEAAIRGTPRSPELRSGPAPGFW